MHDLAPAILDALPVMVAVVDATGRIRRAGSAVDRVLGYPPGTLVGTRVAQLLDPATARAVIRSVRRSVQWFGASTPSEIRVRCADGTWRILQVEARAMPSPEPAGSGGAPLPMAVLSCQDVTESRVAREALGRSETMLYHSQKGELLGRLSGGILHDLNNVLTAIKGNAQLLQLDLADDPVLWRSAEEIDGATNRAVSLTRQLLGFVRRQDPEFTVLDANAVVGNLRTLLTRLLGRGTALDVALAPEPMWVRADAGQVEQVVLNLVVNARDAMPDGGTVEVAMRRVWTDGDAAPGSAPVAPGEYVEISVRDSGSGIEPSVRQRIFDPFFTTKEVGAGTGIGLATVAGIVRAAGGGVEVESTVGVGSTFRILLPFVAGADVPADANGAEPLLGGTESVLLVEDDEAVRRYAESLLRRHGYQVFATGRVDEALSIALAQNRLDVVITDVDLPGTRGDDLARHLGSVIEDIRVVTMSGQGSFDPDVRKPFESSDLLRAVRSALDARGSSPLRTRGHTHA